MRFYLSLIVCCSLLMSCQGQTQKKEVAETVKTYAVEKTEQEWKDQLDPMAFYVLRQAGTERAFSGALNKNYSNGVYKCAGCGTPLYESDYKYDSKSGWPSFDRGIDTNLEFDVDYKLGYARTELKCNTCGGHLGHLFNDGPQNTTGQRHCINSAALTFTPAANEN
jgi:peptide-methionine (R)-S-oxide reductase